MKNTSNPLIFFDEIRWPLELDCEADLRINYFWAIIKTREEDLFERVIERRV